MLLNDLAYMIARIFNQKYKLLVLCTLFLSGFFIYSNTFYGSFRCDDIGSIVDNPAITNILNFQAIWNFWPTRFIIYLSIAFNYHLSQLNVFSYHVFNLIVHLISSILVWWLTLLTFSTPAMKGQQITKHAQIIAFFAGLFFIAHPIQTQGVTYVIQRAASLATLFYLACLSLYVKSKLLQEQGKSSMFPRFLYGGALISAVMAMFTKEMAITLPLMVLLYEACFLKTKEGLNWKYLAPFLATLLIIPLVMFLTKSVDFIGMSRVLESAPNISPWHYLLTQFKVMVTYIRLLFIPINQNLDYDYPVANSLLVLPVFASFIFLALILISAVRMFSKYRLISFGIFWFFLTLLPESSIIPIRDVIFEHRLYLPMAGFSIFLVSIIYYIFENKGIKPVVIVLLITSTCYGILAYKRNIIWEDELVLFNDTVHKSPKKARAYNSRGLAYYNRGNLIQAIFDYNKAIEIKPDFAEAYNSRGLAYDKEGNFAQAIADYTQAIKIKSNLAEAYYNRGNVFTDQGNFAQAISDYTQAIEINPNFAYAFNNRGNAYKYQKNLDQAFADYNDAVRINSNYAMAYYNRGNIYGQQGSFEKAISDYNQAIKINPNLKEAYANRAKAYLLNK